MRIDLLYSQLSSSAVINGSSPHHPVVLSTMEQLDAYFTDPSYSFQLPIKITSTPFQQKVCAALQLIPVGATASYGEIAQQLNTSPRAIGNACGRNPIAIVIPCHRVIAHNHLGGFNGVLKGEPLRIKSWLLKHEGA